MYDRQPRRILFATDGSSGADAALDVLCALRLGHEDRVAVVTIAAGSPFVLDAGLGDVADAYEAALEIAQDAAARLWRCDIVAECRVATGVLAETIVDTARTERTDLIVVGSRGRGLITGTLLGSTARTLARTSPVPVLVVRDRRDTPQRILIAVDGSPDSRAAVDALWAIPLQRGSEVVVLHVAPDGRTDNTRSLDLLSLVASRLPPTFTTRIEVARGDPASGILQRAAAHGSDLITLGSGGGRRGPLQGSTADRVLGGAHCSVLVARAAERVKARTPALDPAAAIAGLI